jgi:hypothetical protein
MYRFVKYDANIKGMGWRRHDKKRSSVFEFGMTQNLKCLKAKYFYCNRQELSL